MSKLLISTSKGFKLVKVKTSAYPTKQQLGDAINFESWLKYIKSFNNK